MKYDLRKSVWDAKEACWNIQMFTAGLTLDIYQKSNLIRSAVERQFEILGEAFNRIEDADPSFRGRFSEMGDAIGMRNRLAHGYDCVDDGVVWLAVKESIPLLLDKLTAWLEKNG
jgi:uncharacterized protein with HEPN domain